jgi:lysyl endopeptidase
MKTSRTRSTAAMTVAGLFCAISVNAAQPQVEQEALLADQEISVESYEAPTLQAKSQKVVSLSRSFNTQAAPVLAIARPAAERIDNARLSNTEAKQRAYQIGVAASLPSSAKNFRPQRLAWVADADGGFVTQFTVNADAAAGIRLGFEAVQLPADFEMRVVGKDATRVLGPVGAEDVDAATNMLWAPISLGDQQTVELRVGRLEDTKRLGLRLTDVSYLFASPLDREGHFMLQAKMSQSCEVNVACSTDSAVQATQKAVARMVYTRGGSSFLCTGTLMNTTAGAVKPYFYSAHHCISSSTVAATLNTFWNYQSSTCNGTSAGNFTQLTRGAFYRYSNANSDALLLELKEAPPSGALYAGWTASAQSARLDSTGIHHPAGDIKKVSRGTLIRTNGTGNGSGASFNEIEWYSGVTEGGSSGSGIFKKSTSGSLQLYGGLWGGASFCTSPKAHDFYSRFDLVFPNIRSFLAP